MVGIVEEQVSEFHANKEKESSVTPDTARVDNVDGA